MKTKSGEKIRFGHNLSVYWSLLKKYKLMLFVILFLALVTEIKFVLDNFLFKILIDKGTEFSTGVLIASEFTNILLIIHTFEEKSTLKYEKSKIN